MSSLHHIRRHLRDHRVKLAVRGAAVAAASAAAVGVWQTGGAVAVPGGIVLGLAAVALLAHLVRYAQHPLREIARFVEGLRYEDLTVRIASRDAGPLLNSLAEGFANVGSSLRRLRTEREEQARYLDMVMRHVPIALLGVRDDGEVSIMNPAARRLLGLPRIRHVSQLGRVSAPLAEALERGSGDRALVQLDHDGRSMDLSIHATRFNIRGETTTLVTLQDIRQELEEKELEAWQQLTRVLTHEIVNSVTPIASLASTAIERMDGPPAGPAPPGEVREALETIERRSQGLVRFVDAYRSLTRLPQPRIERVAVSDLFAGVRMLLAGTLREHRVALETAIRPPDLEVGVDPELIEQVLINLCLNAIQALEGRDGARVELQAGIDLSGRPVIEVVDNGPGIEPEVLERIFVPFFTTKRSGSGIGLSLSRQIVRQHGGSLTVRSEPGASTVFTIRL